MEAWSLEADIFYTSDQRVAILTRRGIKVIGLSIPHGHLRLRRREIRE